jgi:hypothetical protein
MKKHKRDKVKKKYPDVWCYTNMNFTRELRQGLNDARIELQDYKGHILLTVEPLKLNKMEMLAAKAGISVGDDAWLDGDALDALIDMLRDAKKVWLAHYRWMRSVDACKACKKITWVSGGMCPRHRRKT